MMDLVAIKDIGQGEEITICYLNKVPQFKDFLLVSQQDMSQLLLLGKFEYGGGPIFKVVLEC